MLDATQTTRTPPPLTTLPPAAPPAAAEGAADQAQTSGYADCVDRSCAENRFSSELGVGLSDPPVKSGDSTTFTAVAGDAFRTDGKGAVVPPTHTDVDQGDLGDCWLMAGAAAVAHQDAEYIQGRITKNADGTFNVKLGDKTEVVKATFPDAGYADATPGNKKNTLWAALVEKAYAQQAGGYGNLDHGSSSGAAMEKLTGKPSTATSISSSTTADDLYKVLKAGKDGDHPMTVETKKSGVTAPLHADHAYTILDVYERDGQKYAKVYNPWGVNDGARKASDLEHEVKLEDLISSSSVAYVNGG